MKNCDVCNAVVDSELELVEHRTSLGHHVKWEKWETARNPNTDQVRHRCEMCSADCGSLADYSKHLDSVVHRDHLNRFRVQRSVFEDMYDGNEQPRPTTSEKANSQLESSEKVKIEAQQLEPSSTASSMVTEFSMPINMAAPLPAGPRDPAASQEEPTVYVRTYYSSSDGAAGQASSLRSPRPQPWTNHYRYPPPAVEMNRPDAFRHSREPRLNKPKVVIPSGASSEHRQLTLNKKAVKKARKHGAHSNNAFASLSMNSAPSTSKTAQPSRPPTSLTIKSPLTSPTVAATVQNGPLTSKNLDCIARKYLSAASSARGNKMLRERLSNYVLVDSIQKNGGATLTTRQPDTASNGFLPTSRATELLSPTPSTASTNTQDELSDAEKEAIMQYEAKVVGGRFQGLPRKSGASRSSADSNADQPSTSASQHAHPAFMRDVKPEALEDDTVSSTSACYVGASHGLLVPTDDKEKTLLMWSIVKEEVELTEMLNESKSRLLHKRTELAAEEKRHNDIQQRLASLANRKQELVKRQSKG